MPVYPAVDAAARALGRVAAYAGWLDEEEGSAAGPPGGRGHGRARCVRTRSPAGTTDLAVPMSPRSSRPPGSTSCRPPWWTRSTTPLRLRRRSGYPVALKAAGRDAMAKTVAAGLALDLADAGGVRAAWARIAERFGDELVPALVQPMVEPGVDAPSRSGTTLRSAR